MKKLCSVGSLVPLLFLVACAADEGGDDWSDSEGGDLEGIEEAADGLTDLSLQCGFVSGTGVMTLALNTGDIAMVSKASSGAVVINGYGCGGATSTSLKRLNVTGSGGAETLIIDYMGGTFALGTSTGIGLDVDLGGGADALKFRGSKGADTMTFGSTGLCTNSDAIKDANVANVEAFVVTLSDGADVFSGGGNAATGGAAFATAVTVYGGIGADNLRGGAGVDVLHGGDDADTFSTGATPDGADTMNGGAGVDIADYSLRTAAIAVTIDGTANDGFAGETDDVEADVETVKGGLNDDSLTGSANADTLSGGAGVDTLVGLAGNDVLNGDAGDDIFDEGAASNGGDTFNGGAGADTVSYAGRSNTVVVVIDATATDGENGELDKVMTDVENVTGGGGADTITGSTADNVLSGGAAIDTLNGGAGNDTLIGGAAADILNGDAGDDIFDEGATSNGADVMHGHAGIDLVKYTLRTVAVVVVMDGATGSGEALEADIIHTDIENLVGGTQGDTITGNAADNLLEGGLGVDTLNGGLGDDALDGNGGADNVHCDGGDADILLDATVTATTGCEL